MMNSPRRRLCGLLLAAASLSLSPAVAHAAEGGERLTLFGADLAQADITAFQAAARDAGARSQGRRGAAERFDVAALGIPAVKSMTATYVGDRVMTAQYEVAYKSEQLRRMLKSKYGRPDSSGSRLRGEFDAEYLPDGSYVWKFADGMQLVFKKPFFTSEPSTLTYLNAELFAAVEARAKGQAEREAADKARAKANVF